MYLFIQYEIDFRFIADKEKLKLQYQSMGKRCLCDHNDILKQTKYIKSIWEKYVRDNW